MQVLYDVLTDNYSLFEKRSTFAFLIPAKMAPRVQSEVEEDTNVPVLLATKA